MDLNPFSITPIQGGVDIHFVEDFLVEACFRDSTTGEVIDDCTGPNAIKVSDLLASLPAPVLEAFVNETVVRMVMISRGLS